MCTSKSCGDCAHWDLEHAVDIPNPSRLGRMVSPTIKVAPCLSDTVEMCDAPQAFAFMSADATCERYGDGFALNLQSYEQREREWTDKARYRHRRLWNPVPTWEQPGRDTGRMV